QSFASSIPLMRGIVGGHEWRLGFCVCGLAGVAWVAFFYPWYRDNPADKPSVNQAEIDLITAGKRPRPHVAHDGKILKSLFTSSNMWALALLYVFGSFGFSFFITYVPQ